MNLIKTLNTLATLSTQGHRCSPTIAAITAQIPIAAARGSLHYEYVLLDDTSPEFIAELVALLEHYYGIVAIATDSILTVNYVKSSLYQVYVQKAKFLANALKLFSAWAENTSTIQEWLLTSQITKHKTIRLSLTRITKEAEKLTDELLAEYSANLTAILGYELKLSYVFNHYKESKSQDWDLMLTLTFDSPAEVPRAETSTQEG